MDEILKILQILFYGFGVILFIYLIFTLKFIKDKIKDYDEVVKVKLARLDDLMTKTNEALENINQIANDTQIILTKLQNLTDNVTNDYTKIKSKLNIVPIIASIFTLKGLFKGKQTSTPLTNSKTILSGTVEALSKVFKFVNFFKKK